MLIIWFLVGLAVGIAGTYKYLDNKFERTVKDVLDDVAEQLAQFADE